MGNEALNKLGWQPAGCTQQKLQKIENVVVVTAISVAQAVAHTYSVTGGAGRGRVGNTPEIGLLRKPTISSRNGLKGSPPRQPPLAQAPGRDLSDITANPNCTTSLGIRQREVMREGGWEREKDRRLGA